MLAAFAGESEARNKYTFKRRIIDIKYKGPVFLSDYLKFAGPFVISIIGLGCKSDLSVYTPV